MFLLCVEDLCYPSTTTIAIGFAKILYIDDSKLIAMNQSSYKYKINNANVSTIIECVAIGDSMN